MSQGRDVSRGSTLIGAAVQQSMLRQTPTLNFIELLLQSARHSQELRKNRAPP